MEADADDYEWQTKQAEANYADLSVRLQSQTFDQQAAVASRAGRSEAGRVTKEKDEQLLKLQLEPSSTRSSP